MQHFSSNGVEIAFLDEGVGRPIVLVHGFASNATVNWVDTGWVETLAKAGRRVIALDNRGHGQSQKLYDQSAYEAPMMAEDVRRLLDHLDVERAAVMGYSMGARISAFFGLNHPDRVERVVFGGLGINMVRGIGNDAEIAAALEAPSIADVADPTGKQFRLFAEATGSDLRALAACIRASRARITAEALAALRVPALVAVGTEDPVGGSAADLAALIPGARAFPIERRDHMKAVGDKTYKQAVLDFLEEVPA